MRASCIWGLLDVFVGRTLNSASVSCATQMVNISHDIETFFIPDVVTPGDSQIPLEQAAKSVT
jgi:hypothetical protein